jgi:hypothetical protein
LYRWQIFSFVGVECVHWVRRGHVFRRDWSLNVLDLHKMRSRVVFNRLFIEHLHVVHLRQVLFEVGGEL